MELEELTRKIFEEGVDKAKQERNELLDEAQKEAKGVLEEARGEAARVVEAARKEAEHTKAVLDRELKAAADLAFAQVKRRITDCLVDAVLPESVETALKDPGFIEKLILEVAAQWDVEETNFDIEVALSPQTQATASRELAAKLKQLLDRGVAVTVSEELASGFRITPADGSYRVSFEQENFVAFFREYLRERTRSILFPAEGQTDEASDLAQGAEPTKAQEGAGS